MRKIITAIFAFLLFIVPSSVALGNWSPAIRINGQVRDLTPPAQIVNQRIMVPLRFVAEDGALQGSVLWNGAARQVDVTCMGRSFQFQIGSTGVLVDGRLYQLDSAPYIYQNRTYLPLRFFAENLGGVVTWNGARGEVAIEFKNDRQPAPKVFAYYYWGGFPELKEKAALFTDVALRWFETDSQGDLFYEFEDNYGQVLSFLRQQGIKTHASVVFMDKEGLHALLSSPQRRANLIAQLGSRVKQDGYDGVNIDFEFIPAADGANFTLFLKELKSQLGPGKELSAAVFARTAQDNWATAYDYPRIGEIVDDVVVMTYDYHYQTSAAGAVAPLWWVEDVIQYMRTQARIPAGKLLIGMATYGYDWG
ncbi:MAG: glycosyl hydrolase family 18 protein, partial [Syntrophomonadaceae bacterium]